MNPTLSQHAPRLGALALGLAALGLFFSLRPHGLAQDSKPPAAAARAALTVSSAKPSQSALPLRLQANGNIAAWQEASVGSESNGLRLQEVRANVGDVVRAGQVLAVFADDTVRADLAVARASLAEAQAQAAEAAANAERAHSLQGSGALSAQQISQYQTADLAAKARVQSAQAAVQQQELRLRQTQVLAPDGGVISARSATVGAVPGAGNELFRLIRQGRLEWRAEVTAAELARIKVGMPVQVQGANGTSVAGRVRMVAPTVDPQSRNALVYVDLHGIPGGLRTAQPDRPASGVLVAGMFARGEFSLGNSGALTVPQQAVVMRDGFSYVFTIDAANKVAQQKVLTGRRVGEQVEILQGLSAGSSVAVAGAGFLNDGDTVRVGGAP